MARYQVVELRDVVESKDTRFGKWIINNLHKTDRFYDIYDSSQPKEICKDLKIMGFIETDDMRKICVSDLSKDIIEVKQKKSLKPLCRLELFIKS